MHIRIKVLTPQRGPLFFADAGEERTVRRDLGQTLMASGAAELVADPWPTAKSAPSPPSKSRARARKS